MKKIEYQTPEVEIVKLNVEDSLMITYSGENPGVVDGEDGDIAD